MPLNHTIQYIIVRWLALLGCALALVGCVIVTYDNDSVRVQREPKPEKSFVLDDGVDLTMVSIEGGSFLMGSSIGERRRKLTFELDAHNVEVPDFWIGRFEITHAQYSAIMQDVTPYDRDDPLARNAVRWKDALEFCKRVSERTGWDFNLPTEAQWEYACRAGSKSYFSFGDDETKLGDYAWYTGNKSPWREYGAPHKVGEKKPNDWGLYDMHGNVEEWCLDRFEHESLEGRGKTAEEAGFIPRVVKGGAAWFTAIGCHSAYRGFVYEGQAGAGFRVVAMPPNDEVPPGGAKTSSDP